MRDYYPPRARWWIARCGKRIETAPRTAGHSAGPVPRMALAPLDHRIHGLARPRVAARASTVAADLSLFEFVARHQLAAGARYRRPAGGIRAADHLGGLESGCSRLPHAVARLARDAGAGALAAALPEWRNIECLVVRDFYHRYTVDEHTLVAIASLESITRRRASRICSRRFEDPWLVRFALLLHDIGKGSGRDHVAESLRIARDVLDRLGAPEADRATIEFLIAAASGSFRA